MEERRKKKAHKCCFEFKPTGTLHQSQLHPVSYYTLVSRLLCEFVREQGMLGGAGLLSFRNEKTDFLVCSPPLGVELTVVAEGHQGPEDVDGEKGDCKGYEPDSLQPASQLKVVLSPPQAQPAGDGC